MCGRTAAWEAMPVEERALRFGRLGLSRSGVVPPCSRVCVAWCSCRTTRPPRSRADAGLPGPLHDAQPAVPWDGPATGETSRDDRSDRPRTTRRLSCGVVVPVPKTLPGAVTLGSVLRGEHHLTADVVVVEVAPVRGRGRTTRRVRARSSC
jgi:hypothetical protein